MGLLRGRDFRIIFLAFALSSLGDYLALIALVLRLQSTTDSGWAVAGILLTGLIPPVVFAPAAGLLVDRMETVRVLAVTALLQAAVAAGLAFTPAVAPTLALSFLLGMGLAITQPALFALIPRVVGEDRTTSANAYLEVSRWGGATLGPVLAASLTAAVGAGSTLLVDAGTFLVVAAAVPLLHVRRPPGSVRTAEPERPRAHQAREGAAVILRDRLLRLVVPALGFVVMFAALDNVAEVFFAKKVLGAGDTGYGVLVSTWTLGIVAGSTLTGRWIRPAGLAPSVLGGAVIGGLAVAGAAWIAAFPVAVAGFFIGGAANGVDLVAIRSLLHHRTPESVRGRAFSAYYAVIQSAQIVAMGIGGALVEGVGARSTMILAGTASAAVGVVGMALYARIPGRGRVAVPAAEA